MTCYARQVDEGLELLDAPPASLRNRCAEELRGRGIYPYEVPPPPVFDRETQALVGPLVEWDAAAGDVRAFWRVVDLTPEELAVALEGAKVGKLQEIASARYDAEVAGITVAGATIRTDRESQAMITGAALKAIQDTAYICTWKGESGWVTLTAQQILGIADAVRAHVQGCFNREAGLAAQVQAAETVEAVQAINW